MSEELKRHMRERIEQCRRLAKYINDPRTTEALLRMANEGEADLRKLEAGDAGEDEGPQQIPPPEQH